MPTNSSTEPARRKTLLPAVLAVLALAFFAWRAAPDGKLRVMFLETKGDAALIQTPTGAYILVDGGSDPAALAAALGRHLPFWRRSLDAVVLTSAGNASLPGQVAALARYRTNIVLAPQTIKRSVYRAEWGRLLAEQGAPVHAARAGQRFPIGGVTLRVLAADDDGESGIVLRLDYGATSVVFDQNGDEGDEKALAARSNRPVSLLVFPWERDPHTPFVAALRPRAMVLSDGHQADRPVEQTFVERAIGGAALYHKRLDGTITWVSDGTRAWVETER